jgi:hypothetical protein
MRARLRIGRKDKPMTKNVAAPALPPQAQSPDAALNDARTSSTTPSDALRNCIIGMVPARRMVIGSTASTRCTAALVGR